MYGCVEWMFVWMCGVNVRMNIIADIWVIIIIFLHYHTSHKIQYSMLSRVDKTKQTSTKFHHTNATQADKCSAASSHLHASGANIGPSMCEYKNKNFILVMRIFYNRIQTNLYIHTQMNWLGHLCGKNWRFFALRPSAYASVYKWKIWNWPKFTILAMND